VKAINIVLVVLLTVSGIGAYDYFKAPSVKPLLRHLHKTARCRNLQVLIDETEKQITIYARCKEVNSDCIRNQESAAVPISLQQSLSDSEESGGSDPVSHGAEKGRTADFRSFQGGDGRRQAGNNQMPGNR
jgi:hypothetical protein